MLIFPDVVSVTFAEAAPSSEPWLTLMTGAVGAGGAILGALVGAWVAYRFEMKRELRQKSFHYRWWQEELEAVRTDAVEAMQQLELNMKELQQGGESPVQVVPRLLDDTFIFDKDLVFRAGVTYSERRALHYLKIHSGWFNHLQMQAGERMRDMDKTIPMLDSMILQLYLAAANVVFSAAVVVGDVDSSPDPLAGVEALEADRKRVLAYAEDLSGTSLGL